MNKFKKFTMSIITLLVAGTMTTACTLFSGPTSSGEPSSEQTSSGQTSLEDSVSTSTSSVVEKQRFTVSFDSQGGTEVRSHQVVEGGEARKPADPTKDGYGFEYWTLDGEEFVFDTEIMEDVTLVAKWGPYQTRLGELVDFPATWDFDAISITDADGTDAKDNAVVEDGQLSFRSEGAYKFMLDGTEIGLYNVEPFLITTIDFDRVNELTYGEFTVEDVNGISVTTDMFKWTSAIYQPTLKFESSLIARIKRMASIVGYDTMIIHIRYVPTLENQVMQFKYTGAQNESEIGVWVNGTDWSERKFNIEKLEELGIFSCQQGYEFTVYFYIEFANL